MDPKLRAELERIREAKCSCGSTRHHAVDLDGPGGEYLRVCADCGSNFRVAAFACSLDHDHKTRQAAERCERLA